jgi:hypothetical protein
MTSESRTEQRLWAQGQHDHRGNGDSAQRQRTAIK